MGEASRTWWTARKSSIEHAPMMMTFHITCESFGWFSGCTTSSFSASTSLCFALMASFSP